MYEACTKFPIGGMFATLAQALHRVKLILSDCSSLAKLQPQHNVVQSKKKKALKYKKKCLDTKSGHKKVIFSPKPNTSCFLNASWFLTLPHEILVAVRLHEWCCFKTGSWGEILLLTVMRSRTARLICTCLVSQLSHAEGCSILYHRWINILKKPLQAAHPKRPQHWSNRYGAEEGLGNAALIVNTEPVRRLSHIRCLLPCWY